MKILAVTDLHGGSVKKLLDFTDIDLVLVLGDITTGKGVRDTRARIEPLRDAYPSLYAIPGNWDRADSSRWLASEGLNLDCRSITMDRLVFYGVGGSTTTPFSTPNEFTEADFPHKLSGCPNPKADERLILLSHNPPHGACDRTALGMHVGSKYLRSFIEERSPALALCGHIHEGRDVANIGSTIVVNPGPAPGHYVIVDTRKDISVKLY